jgi:hypothetical protein
MNHTTHQRILYYWPRLAQKYTKAQAEEWVRVHRSHSSGTRTQGTGLTSDRPRMRAPSPSGPASTLGPRRRPHPRCQYRGRNPRRGPATQTQGGSGSSAPRPGLARSGPPQRPALDSPHSPPPSSSAPAFPVRSLKSPPLGRGKPLPPPSSSAAGLRGPGGVGARGRRPGAAFLPVHSFICFCVLFARPSFVCQSFLEEFPRTKVIKQS